VLSARAAFGQYLPDWHPYEDYRAGYSARRDLGGGIILDAIHEVDFLRWLAGEMQSVACFSGRLSSLEIDTEDTAALLLRFANGAIGEIHLDYVQRAYSRSAEIIGEKGTIRWDYALRAVRWYSAEDRRWRAFNDPETWEPNDMYLDEMRHFLRCLDGAETPALDLINAKRVLEIALAAKAAAENRRVVELEMKPSGNTVAIVQARMGATRFPGKVLEPIEHRPMLWHVVERVRKAKLVDRVAVATSQNPVDEAIAKFCEAEKIDCFRGSERDVLDRYYRAAKEFGADSVVRVTADCPLIDPELIDAVVETRIQESCDYATNTLGASYPDGVDVEVFSFAALERAWRSATLPADREHVTSYIINSGAFRVRDVSSGAEALGRLRWTVDHPQDLEFVRAIYARLRPLNGNGFGYRQVLRLLDLEPGLAAINGGTIRNEGYYRSLAAEPFRPAEKRPLARSDELKRKAERLIPSCSQTFSKAPSQYVQGVAPAFLARGDGSHVWDVDGNEYIDCPMALGSVILGHNYPNVSAAVKRQIDQGTNFSLPHTLEASVAEMLVELIPCAEMVRFGKNGSDATAGAVRAARAYTGRDVIACCGYHGWQDWYIGTT
ncbi:MAG TPA: aminotransferase class III-fold pyridoxal phosphate-dependent enzyme, partial [Candidatus Binatia bacterium]|nr:aminotransferase class III-fold pyridoxal phosphate-dependent enzyme [Candidatus Binatia bacterium]